MNLTPIQKTPRTISRDNKVREITTEQKLPAEPIQEVETEASRREFFRAFIPASSKVLTNILRGLGTTFSSVIEDTKSPKK